MAYVREIDSQGREILREENALETRQRTSMSLYEKGARRLANDRRFMAATFKKIGGAEFELQNVGAQLGVDAFTAFRISQQEIPPTQEGLAALEETYGCRAGELQKLVKYMKAEKVAVDPLTGVAPGSPPPAPKPPAPTTLSDDQVLADIEKRRGLKPGTLTSIAKQPPSLGTGDL